MPIMPPAFGILTDFTFFIIFPDTYISIFLGLVPSTSTAFAQAYASAIGSVHP